MAEVRARLRSAGPQRGSTLVEMLVAMSIFSLAMTLVFGAVITVMRKSSDVQKSADASSALRISLERIDRQVRSGNVLYSPAGETSPGCTGDPVSKSGTCMRVFTQANGPERCVQWQVMADPASPGTNLLQTRSWSLNWATGGDHTPWATITRGLAIMPVGSYPFTLRSESIYGARLLDVTLAAYDARRKTSVVITSSMSGRNTTYGYSGLQCASLPPN